MTTHRRPTRNGFTLIETLVALFIATLMVLNLAPALFSAAVTVKRSQHIEQATQFAHQQVEALRRKPFDELRLPTGRDSVSESLDVSGDLPNPAAQVVLTRVDGSLAASGEETGRRKVVVTVSWAGVGQDRGSVAVTSLITLQPGEATAIN